MVHDLKVWPRFFNLVLSGEKPFEVRRADRPYKVGDQLRLQEWDPDTRAYTGRECMVLVTYLLSDEWPGVSAGHAILGISRTLPVPLQMLEGQALVPADFDPLSRILDSVVYPLPPGKIVFTSPTPLEIISAEADYERKNGRYFSAQALERVAKKITGAA